jgi:hypothetical protein
MAPARYFLHQADGSWLVTLEGRVLARHQSRTEAIEAAAVMADLMGAMHHEADVMAEIEDGAPLELVWVHGKDLTPKTRSPPHDGEVAGRHVKLVQRGEREKKAAIAAR